MTKIKYSRPQNMKEISDLLRAMQAANDYTLVNELNDQYEELEQEQWGKDEYINELQQEIKELEDELNDQGN
ncbi:hypothetical protein [Mammaliicoccus sciuri]|uniref:hypothetical protein n=1 Tax=Mammaliicoccus sciuri TaxID=1296 RepID=UPI001953D94C|nr:hypothetical protein [Mammaliicoccus sciuri]